MRSLVLAAATAAAVAVPGNAHALPSGLFAYCDAHVVSSAGPSRDVAFVAHAYVFFQPVIATWVGCEVRYGDTVLGAAQMASPGVASVAPGTASVPWWTSAEVCVTAYGLYGDGSKIVFDELCTPLAG